MQLDKNNKIISVVGIAVFKNKKILMVRPKKFTNTFFFIGGKIEREENFEEAATRECEEEIGVQIKEGTLKFLNNFETQAHGEEEGVKVKMKLCQGELGGEPYPNSEIAEIQYFDTGISEEKLNPLSSLVFAWLKKNNYIN